MKRKNVFLGLLVLILAFVFTTCEPSAPTPGTVVYTSTDGTNTYILTITENLNRSYYEQTGDRYELFINPGNRISKGIIYDISGSTYTLAPETTSVTFTVSVVGAFIIDISGTITLTTGSGTVTGPGFMLPEARDGFINFSTARQYPLFYYNNWSPYTGANTTINRISIHAVHDDFSDNRRNISDITDNPSAWDIRINGSQRNISLRLGIPKESELINAYDWNNIPKSGVTVTPGDLKIFTIVEFYVSEDYLPFLRWGGPPRDSWIYFLYANKDAIIVGRSGGQVFNLNLKQGWNTYNYSGKYPFEVLLSGLPPADTAPHGWVYIGSGN